MRWCSLVWIGLLAVPVAAQPKPETSSAPDRRELEKKFQESLSGATLVGSYTVVGQTENKPPKAERYTIVRVGRLGELWLLHARIQYGDKDVTVPIPLRVEWAGDTPVITMTDQTIPGLGTFTARVMFYRGQYAGTWQHDAVRGQMFGVIEKAKP
jgi:hypothetical protein